MNILVIKQTSLGDVLHSSGHIRVIKQNFPRSHLTVLTAKTSAGIFRHNPNVDELILFERRKKKHALRHFVDTAAKVRARNYDLAFDLQGLARSVIFLYAARARKKFVKGNWPGSPGFRDKKLHAITEMDNVLALAGLQVGDTAMEWFGDSESRARINNFLARENPANLPLLVCSPFSRWQSKNWPLMNYVELAQKFGGEVVTVFCGDESSRAEIAGAISRLQNPNLHNLAGALSAAEFAELIARAKLVVSGDSFPMHLACARKISAVALFGPTFETRTGPPPGAPAKILRAPGCNRCDRANCPRRCLRNLPVDAVFAAARAVLRAPDT